MEVTQELVLNYMLEQRGKVSNSDLLKKFKPLLESPDPQERAYNRDLFKRYVNKIAVVRDEDGVKVVVLKKRHTHLLTGGGQPSYKRAQGEEGSLRGPEKEPGCPSVTENKAEALTPTPDHEQFSREDLSEPDSLPVLGYHSVGDLSHESIHEAKLDELVSITQCENEGERESVFAIVARMDNYGPVLVPKLLSDGQPKDVQKPPMLPLRYTQTSSDTLDVYESEKTLPSYVTTVPQATPTPPAQAPLTVLSRSPNAARQFDDAGSKSPHLKRSSKLMKVNEDRKFEEAVPLIQHEHEWLVNAANGRWNHRLLGLMMIHSDLADKRDFISGFTALHWAAKSGNAEMVKLLFDLSRKGDSNLNVNVKSFGGYTPLHIAAIHDRKEVISLLVQDYNAKVYIRDNSGRKPYHYLKKGCSMQLRNILQDTTTINLEKSFHMKRNSKVAASILGTTGAFLGVISDEIPFPDLARGLKKPGSVNKFFTAPSGFRKKLKAMDSYPSRSALCEDPEEAEDVAGKRRPVSEFFTPTPHPQPYTG
ncbi:ankyrin repeat domain-containing protein SOWAHA [Gastrophryne carolinensis]